MSFNRSEAKDQLEAMIDQRSLKEVLDMLAEICHEKADHLRSNWQDEAAARDWERMGNRILFSRIAPD
jgi:hypothetical protein